MNNKLIATMILAGSMAFAAEPNAPTLEARARTAVTATDHADVSRAFRLRAQEMDATAKQHEAEAAKIGPNVIGVPAKWPGMAVNTPYEKAKRRALEARRAANESRELSAKHAQLATEAAFASADSPAAVAAANSATKPQVD